MNAIELTLPYPPSANNLYATVRGRRVKSRKGKEYEQAIALLVLRSRCRAAPIQARLSVELDISPPDRRKRDIANTEKAVIDALVKAGVIWDDSLIDRLLLRRFPPVDGGKVVVRIEEIR